MTVTLYKILFSNLEISEVSESVGLFGWLCYYVGMSESTDPLVTWKKQTTAFDRVISVVTVLGEGRSIGWIADEAAVNEETVEEHLDRLHKLNVIRTEVADDGSSLYKIDPLYGRYQMLRQFLDEYDSESELRELQTELSERAERIAGKFDVETPGELRELADGEEDTEQRKQLMKQASVWESTMYRRDVLDEAIEKHEQYS